MCSVGALRVTKITTGAAIWEVKTTSSVTSSRTYSKIFARSTWSTDLIEPERIIFTSPYLRMRNEPFCRGRSSVLVIFALVCRYSVILFYLDRVSSSVKTWLWIKYRKNILIQALVFHTAFSFSVLWFTSNVYDDEYPCSVGIFEVNFCSHTYWY